jgi:hypothetical protein
MLEAKIEYLGGGGVRTFKSFFASVKAYTGGA